MLHGLMRFFQNILSHVIIQRNQLFSQDNPINRMCEGIDAIRVYINNRRPFPKPKSVIFVPKANLSCSCGRSENRNGTDK